MAHPPSHGKLPYELPEWAEEDLRYWREASMEEHACALEAVCSAVMDILEARKQMGMAPPEPEPWPESTLEFMRRHAPNGRKPHSDS
jgi:hypothetical protein